MNYSAIQQSDKALSVRPFLREVEVRPDEQSIERALKLALRRLPENERLTFFAHAITSPLPHAAKAALWRVIRYSHFWWNVDALLQGDVMGNPVVQRAFADAVSMRRWRVQHRRRGWEDAVCTLSSHELDGLKLEPQPHGATMRQMLVTVVVRGEDAALADFIRSLVAKEVPRFVDARGNGILWHLTYREDQHADGGFACPRTAQTLISLGADPFRENELGLCWNDVARHFVRKM
jgi:hypothetical protein